MKVASAHASDAGNEAPRGLQLCDVHIAIANRQLIAVSSAIAPGEILTVMGPSGSGKSALLAYIAGTLAPAFVASGDILLDGRRLNALPSEARHTGILFQDDLLFPHLSVAGNLAFALSPEVRGAAERRSAISAALTRAGLAGFAHRDPATLSGGQRARVALLRVLLSQPRALLLDEPFSKLDAALRAQFRAFVFSEARRHQLPTIMVTHDPADASAANGRVIALD
jgi:putative thiamine transport system ATP-binding protein